MFVLWFCLFICFLLVFLVIYDVGLFGWHLLWLFVALIVCCFMVIG